ncbi:M20 family metallopeptidase [Kitasatospora sp. NPDC089509]|uniref:M20 metallopeptidase family protein n=1 Tax=Kitasatospora sp. NPDC089509 TaxID=3364079 RepID=UPI00380D3444
MPDPSASADLLDRLALPELARSAARIQPELTTLRRKLHQVPEIALDLPRTRELLLGALDGLPLELTLGKELSSITAVLHGGRPGPAVLLRADMDALPVQENVRVPYASRIPGQMHACGHDLHMAALVGATRLLAERQAELPGDVVLMFQPGEEGAGGAQLMVDAGVLEAAGRRVVAAYALHVASALLPNGVVAARPGPMLAASDTLWVTLRGRGGHGSSPHSALDPVPALCEAVLALQTMVTRRLDAFDPVVLTVGTLNAGTAANVIPDEARFSATLRSFSERSRDLAHTEALRVVRGVAAAHGLEAVAEVEPGYPVTVNDPVEAAFAAGLATRLLGPERYAEMPQPIAGSEDFGVLAALVPSAFVMLGAVPTDGRDPFTAPYNHSPDAEFDDSVLADGAALLAGLALGRLARG